MTDLRRIRVFALGAAAASVLAGCATPGGIASPTVAPAPAPDERERAFAADFHSFITRALSRLGAVPGLSVVVARHDGPIFIRGYGMADYERGVAATPDTRFYIASSTKSLVALALAALDLRGEIDLNWTLAELAPDIAFAPEVRAREVTLRHLLSHSHGLAVPGMEFRLAYSGEHDPATLWRLLSTARAKNNAPLGTFEYGNVGYNVATLLLERRLRRSWQEILETEVLRPFGMRQTHARGLVALRAAHPFAVPYDSLGAGGRERLDLLKVDRNMQSAGGLFSSANDLARWLALQLAAAKGERNLPLPADLIARTHAPVATTSGNYGPFQRAAYGLGWYSGQLGGHTLYHSFGGYTGARSHVSFMPALDLGVAVVTNDEGTGAPFTDIAAIYAYSWFSEGPEAAERRAGELLGQIEAQVQRRREGVAADRARRAGRSWTLGLPRSAYAGRYCNLERGTLEIAADGDKLELRMGELRTVAEPFTDRETIRVELIPREGMVVRFDVDNQRVTGLRAFETAFRRCG